MIINWNVSPEIFEWGPMRIRWYGMMFLIGFFIGFRLMEKACKSERKPVAHLDTLLTYLVLGTTIGARLGHVLFYDPIYYFANPLSVFKIWEGGLASHGGGTGVIFAIWLFNRKYKDYSWLWLLDRISIFTVMTGGFIRIGNLMNSEIVGKPTDGTWGFVFQSLDRLPRHPAMIYESICYFLIFFVAYFGIYKPNLKNNKQLTPPGFIFGFVITMIMVCRFGIEFFKEVQSPFEKDMFLDMGQILSLPFIIIGCYLMLTSKKRNLNA